jgi:putative flippase GtrA
MNVLRRLHQDARVRHGSAFLFSGAMAFLVDAAVTVSLAKLVGFDRFSARMFGILLAQVVSWRLHRTLTFAVKAPVDWREIVRFGAVAWSANGVNYVVYAGLLLMFPRMPILAALVLGSAAAMVFSYLGLRFGVFRRIAFGEDA